MSTHLFLVSVLIILYTQVSNATDCNVTAPDNSQIILDSRIYHTLNPLRATAITDWTLLDVDMMTYPILGTQIGSEWEVQLSLDDCSPHYASCPPALITVDPDIERNWIVTSYYVTEADNIEIRIDVDLSLS